MTIHFKSEMILPLSIAGLAVLLLVATLVLTYCQVYGFRRDIIKVEDVAPPERSPDAPKPTTSAFKAAPASQNTPIPTKAIRSDRELTQ